MCFVFSVYWWIFFVLSVFYPGPSHPKTNNTQGKKLVFFFNNLFPHSNSSSYNFFFYYFCTNCSSSVSFLFVLLFWRFQLFGSFHTKKYWAHNLLPIKKTWKKSFWQYVNIYAYTSRYRLFKNTVYCTNI